MPSPPNLQGLIKQQVDQAIRALYSEVQAMQTQVAALTAPPPVVSPSGLQSQLDSLTKTVNALNRSVNVTNVTTTVYGTTVYIGSVVSVPTQANLPTGLGSGDKDTLAYVADKDHTLRWTGVAWDWARGDDKSGYWRFSDVDPGIGWQLADGSTVNRLNGDGTLTAVTVPDLTTAANKAAYMKMGSPVAGPTAATAPTVTNPATTGSGTANVTNPATTGTGFASLGNPTLATAITTGAPTTNVAAFPHTHSDAGHTHTLGAPTDSGHTHTIAAPTVGTNAEPRSLTRLPYYRL